RDRLCSSQYRAGHRDARRRHAEREKSPRARLDCARFHSSFARIEIALIGWRTVSPIRVNRIRKTIFEACLRLRLKYNVAERLVLVAAFTEETRMGEDPCNGVKR